MNKNILLMVFLILLTGSVNFSKGNSIQQDTVLLDNLAKSDLVVNSDIVQNNELAEDEAFNLFLFLFLILGLLILGSGIVLTTVALLLIFGFISFFQLLCYLAFIKSPFLRALNYLIFFLLRFMDWPLDAPYLLSLI